MKTNHLSPLVAASALVLGLPFVDSAKAQITGINAANSYATNVFNDLNSLSGGTPGGRYVTGVNPWTGAAWPLNQTDPNTLDYANAVIAANGSGNSYNLSVNLDLAQDPGSIGYADMTFWFNVSYQLGAGGLPSQTTLSPYFLVSGVVDSALGSHASIQGNIWYYGINGGSPTLLDTVNYNWSDYAPGAFNNVVVSGLAANGSTSALAANSVLDVSGYLTFEVDPSSLSVETVPEPGTLALAGLGAIGLFAFRRGRKA